MTTGEEDRIRLGSRYELLDRLGSGATGTVWRALRTGQDGGPVAVKVLDPRYGQDPGIVTRFLAERTVLIGMRSPYLVQVQDLVAEGDTLAIVMDLIEGGDLRSYLDANAPLEPSVAFELTGHVLSALGTVHHAGILHQDVKPANVVMDLRDPGRPRALLTDFGVAQGIHEVTGELLMGTPNYMAPELLSGRAAPSVASDLFGVGAVLFEMLTGRRHDGTRSVPGLPYEAARIVADLLDPDPAQRPRSASQARGLLVAAGETVIGMDAIPPAPSFNDQETVTGFDPRSYPPGGGSYPPGGGSYPPGGPGAADQPTVTPTPTPRPDARPPADAPTVAGRPTTPTTPGQPAYHPGSTPPPSYPQQFAQPPYQPPYQQYAPPAPPPQRNRTGLIVAVVVVAVLLVAGIGTFVAMNLGKDDDQGTTTAAGKTSAATPSSTPSASVAESATKAANGPYGEEQDIAAAFPKEVPADPGTAGDEGQTCSGAPATSDFSNGKILCKFPDGQQLSLLRFATTADRDKREGVEASRPGASKAPWSAGDGADRQGGTLYIGMASNGPYRWWSFDRKDRQTYAMNVRWEGHTQSEVAQWWTSRAPF